MYIKIGAFLPGMGMGLGKNASLGGGLLVYASVFFIRSKGGVTAKI